MVEVSLLYLPDIAGNRAGTGTPAFRLSHITAVTAESERMAFNVLSPPTPKNASVTSAIPFPLSHTCLVSFHRINR